MIGKRVVSGLWVVVGLIVALVVGGFLGLVLINKKRTGKWRMPTGNDLHRVKKALTHSPAPPSRVIYLHRGKLAVAAGDDDAAKNVSSIVARHSPRGATVPGWTGTTRSWNRIVRCVQLTFRHFPVKVTDKRPGGSEDYIMVAVGGRPKDVGVKATNMGGLAPYSGSHIAKAVVFVFSRALGNRIKATCETIAHEVAHVYGLDHSYHCKDIMTYLHGCGVKSFVDRDVACGEHEVRSCTGGNKTQNSYRHLVALLRDRPRKSEPDSFFAALKPWVDDGTKGVQASEVRNDGKFFSALTPWLVEHSNKSGTAFFDALSPWVTEGAEQPLKASRR